MEFLYRIEDGQPFVATQWNGMADDLGAVSEIGFDLQPEEGQRTGSKPLVVHDPVKSQFNYNPLKIPLHGWALRNLTTGELVIVDNEELPSLFTTKPPLHNHEAVKST